MFAPLLAITAGSISTLASCTLKLPESQYGVNFKDGQYTLQDVGDSITATFYAADQNLNLTWYWNLDVEPNAANKGTVIPLNKNSGNFDVKYSDNNYTITIKYVKKFQEDSEGTTANKLNNLQIWPVELDSTNQPKDANKNFAEYSRRISVLALTYTKPELVLAQNSIVKTTLSLSTTEYAGKFCEKGDILQISAAAINSSVGVQGANSYDDDDYKRGWSVHYFESSASEVGVPVYDLSDPVGYENRTQFYIAEYNESYIRIGLVSPLDLGLNSESYLEINARNNTNPSNVIQAQTLKIKPSTLTQAAMPSLKIKSEEKVISGSKNTSSVSYTPYISVPNGSSGENVFGVDQIFDSLEYKWKATGNDVSSTTITEEITEPNQTTGKVQLKSEYTTIKTSDVAGAKVIMNVSLAVQNGKSSLSFTATGAGFTQNDTLYFGNLRAPATADALVGFTFQAFSVSKFFKTELFTEQTKPLKFAGYDNSTPAISYYSSGQQSIVLMNSQAYMDNSTNQEVTYEWNYGAESSYYFSIENFYILDVDNQIVSTSGWTNRKFTINAAGTSTANLNDGRQVKIDTTSYNNTNKTGSIKISMSVVPDGQQKDYNDARFSIYFKANYGVSSTSYTEFTNDACGFVFVQKVFTRYYVENLSAKNTITLANEGFVLKVQQENLTSDMIDSPNKYQIDFLAESSDASVSIPSSAYSLNFDSVTRQINFTLKKAWENNDLKFRIRFKVIGNAYVKEGKQNISPVLTLKKLEDHSYTVKMVDETGNPISSVPVLSLSTLNTIVRSSKVYLAWFDGTALLNTVPVFGDVTPNFSITFATPTVDSIYSFTKNDSTIANVKASATMAVKNDTNFIEIDKKLDVEVVATCVVTGTPDGLFDTNFETKINFTSTPNPKTTVSIVKTGGSLTLKDDQVTIVATTANLYGNSVDYKFSLTGTGDWVADINSLTIGNDPTPSIPLFILSKTGNNLIIKLGKDFDEYGVESALIYIRASCNGTDSTPVTQNLIDKKNYNYNIKSSAGLLNTDLSLTTSNTNVSSSNKIGYRTWITEKEQNGVETVYDAKITPQGSTTVPSASQSMIWTSSLPIADYLEFKNSNPEWNNDSNYYDSYVCTKPGKTLPESLSETKITVEVTINYYQRTDATTYSNTLTTKVINIQLGINPSSGSIVWTTSSVLNGDIGNSISFNTVEAALFSGYGSFAVNVKLIDNNNQVVNNPGYYISVSNTSFTANQTTGVRSGKVTVVDNFYTDKSPTSWTIQLSIQCFVNPTDTTPFKTYPLTGQLKPIEPPLKAAPVITTTEAVSYWSRGGEITLKNDNTQTGTWAIKEDGGANDISIVGDKLIWTAFTGSASEDKQYSITITNSIPKYEVAECVFTLRILKLTPITFAGTSLSVKQGNGGQMTIVPSVPGGTFTLGATPDTGFTNLQITPSGVATFDSAGDDIIDRTFSFTYTLDTTADPKYVSQSNGQATVSVQAKPAATITTLSDSVFKDQPGSTKLKAVDSSGAELEGTWKLNSGQPLTSGWSYSDGILSYDPTQFQGGTDTETMELEFTPSDSENYALATSIFTLTIKPLYKPILNISNVTAKEKVAGSVNLPVDPLAPLGSWIVDEDRTTTSIYGKLTISENKILNWAAGIATGAYNIGLIFNANGAVGVEPFTEISFTLTLNPSIGLDYKDMFGDLVSFLSISAKNQAIDAFGISIPGTQNGVNGKYSANAADSTYPYATTTLTNDGTAHREGMWDALGEILSPSSSKHATLLSIPAKYVVADQFMPAYENQNENGVPKAPDSEIWKIRSFAEINMPSNPDPQGFKNGDNGERALTFQDSGLFAKHTQLKRTGSDSTTDQSIAENALIFKIYAAQHNNQSFFDKYSITNADDTYFKGISLGVQAAQGVQIGKNAFKDCTGIEEVMMDGDNIVLTSIGENAFKGCNDLTKFDFGSSVPSSWSKGTFTNCTNLTTFIFRCVAPPNEDWRIQGIALMSNSVFYDEDNVVHDVPWDNQYVHSGSSPLNLWLIVYSSTAAAANIWSWGQFVKYDVNGNYTSAGSNACSWTVTNGNVRVNLGIIDPASGGIA